YSGDFSSQGHDVYKLCLKEDDKKFLYLHLRFNFGKIDTVYYLITCGDEKVILADLNNALQKIK
ncbi:hypothetical protein KKA27_02455, partial [Patescibacteria group bacterium]|nr:hypothetical protein [Patescibacteria group bacterium]